MPPLYVAEASTRWLHRNASAHKFGDIHVGHIIQRHILHAPLRQPEGQDLSGVFRVAINGAAENGHSLLLRGIGAPALVFLYEPADILPPDGAVEGTDPLDLQIRSPLEQGLDLGTVLAHDIGIIPAASSSQSRSKFT